MNCEEKSPEWYLLSDIIEPEDCIEELDLPYKLKPVVELLQAI